MEGGRRGRLRVGLAGGEGLVDRRYCVAVVEGRVGHAHRWRLLVRGCHVMHSAGRRRRRPDAGVHTQRRHGRLLLLLLGRLVTRAGQVVGRAQVVLLVMVLLVVLVQGAVQDRGVAKAAEGLKMVHVADEVVIARLLLLLLVVAELGHPVVEEHVLLHLGALGVELQAAEALEPLDVDPAAPEDADPVEDERRFEVNLNWRLVT